ARGGFHIDTAVVGQAHLVVAGLADFAIVAVGRGVLLVVETLGIGRIEIATRADRAGDRQHRYLTALLPATGAGNEGMPEATDLLVVIAPAGVMAADRADLDQTERGGCARERIAVILAADEGVDLALQRSGGGLQQRREGQRQQTGDTGNAATGG